MRVHGSPAVREDEASARHARAVFGSDAEEAESGKKYIERLLRAQETTYGGLSHRRLTARTMSDGPNMSVQASHCAQSRRCRAHHTRGSLQRQSLGLRCEAPSRHRTAGGCEDTSPLHCAAQAQGCPRRLCGMQLQRGQGSGVSMLACRVNEGDTH